MTINYAVIIGVVWVVLMFVLMGRMQRRSARGRWRHRPGAITAGAIYDLLNEDRRKAIEMVVEGRAEARDPEDRDGNLPDLEDAEGTADGGGPTHQHPAPETDCVTVRSGLSEECAYEATVVFSVRRDADGLERGGPTAAAGAAADALGEPAAQLQQHQDELDAGAWPTSSTTRITASRSALSR